MNRIFHTWDKWECYPAGFYEKKPKDKSLSDEDCRQIYADFLRDENRFSETLEKVIVEWKFSCEHYLTNEKMNRIAWLGQAALCYATGIPAIYKGGFNRLSDDEKLAADMVALKYLNKWLKANGRDELTYEEAQSKTEANIY